MRESILKFLEENEISQSRFAKTIGVNGAYLSGYLKDGDDYQYANKVITPAKLYIDNYNEKNRKQPRKSEFVMTSDVKNAFFVMDDAVSIGKMAVIVGTAGAGKTRAIKEYAKLRPNAVLIEATIRTRGKELFTMIADELGVKYQTSQDATVRACADELKRSDKFFIIDEAEHLPYAALELLRRLHDFSSSALILVGTDALVDNLRGSANTRKGREFRQLSSRIVGKYEYRGLTQRKEIDGRVTEDLKDLREVCARYGIEDLKSVEMIKRLARANWRKSENLIERAKRLGAYYENRIDKEIIKEASSMIFLD